MYIYDSARNEKVKFEPRNPEHIKIYVCGPTVYNEIHVGNARAVLSFDLLYRVLLKKYPKVTYARNITDIDDKIINKAKEEGIDSVEVSKKWSESFQENCKKLNSLTPTHQPKATETVSEIIDAIIDMIDNDFAYVTNDTVYFRSSALDNYGSLSKQHETISGLRIAIEESKEDPKDFVLWKLSKPGEPFWISPWGRGRPGWHIECSAMSAKFLGESFDIHGGGADLLFPHHENEQAQNTALFGEGSGPKYWMHNGMVLFSGEKMSKSLGNIVLLSQAFEKFDPIFVRFFILSTHYRHPLIWNQDNINAAFKRFQRWHYHLLSAHITENEIIDEIYAPLENDLNIVESFAVIDKLLSQAVADKDKDLLNKIASSINWLGCYSKKSEISEDLKSKLDAKLEKRNQARKEKYFEQADLLRAEMEHMGFEICDSLEGSFYYKIS